MSCVDVFVGFCERASALRLTALLGLLLAQQGCSADLPDQLAFPLGADYVLVYEGGVRLKAGTVGTSRIAYSPGVFAVSPDDRMLWVAGHTQHYSIAAYELPDPNPSLDIADLPVAKIAQPFVQVAPPVTTGGLPDRVVGMQLIDSKLFVNTAEYYDADANNLNTTVVFGSPYDLGSSEQHGYFQMQGAVHAAGWMTPVPKSLRAQLGAPYIAGFASNLPIDSRASMGPTMFLWNPENIPDGKDADRTIPTTKLIDYSLKNPLHPDAYNKSRENRLWTEVSKARLGFIAPQSNDYIVIGSSAGHNSGLGYKATQDNGNVCGGACSFDHRDYYNYFWLYDLEDSFRVKRGELRPHEVRPSDYGKLPLFTGVEKGLKSIGGAAFNPVTGRLHVLIKNVDATQGKYEKQPILLSYSLWRRVGGKRERVTDPHP